jgi:hypothetical protein
MDKFYFIPHVGFRQEPAPFPDWDVTDQAGIAAKCTTEEGCAGFDTDNNIRDTSSARYEVLHFLMPPEDRT